MIYAYRIYVTLIRQYKIYFTIMHAYRIYVTMLHVYIIYVTMIHINAYKIYIFVAYFCSILLHIATMTHVYQIYVTLTHIDCVTIRFILENKTFEIIITMNPRPGQISGRELLRISTA